MEKRTKEELVAMSHEELEALVMHLQHEVEEMASSLSASREIKNVFQEKCEAMECRLNILHLLLESWK